jgi:O-antigen ligase
MLGTEAIRYKPQWFQNRTLLLGTLAVVCIGLMLRTVLPITLSFILAVQLVLFVLVFKRPVWAMAALIIIQFTAIDYKVLFLGTQVTIRLIWAVLATLLVVLYLKQDGGIKLGKKAFRVIIPAVIFVCIVIISNLVNTGFSGALTYLRLNAVGLVILFLMPAAVKNEKDARRLAIVALVAASISAVVAVMQHYSSMGLPLIELYPGTWNGLRAPGLAQTEVDLAFYLPLVIVVIAALYFVRGGVDPRMRKFLPFLALVMAAGLYFTYSRSGMYALAPGLLAMVLLMKGKAKMRLLLVFLILGIAFLMFTQIASNRYAKGFSGESSAAGRLVLWQAGLNIAQDNPLLGIGAWRFTQVSPEYASSIDPELMATLGAGADLGRYPAHDDFITVWASFGTPALLAYLWIFVAIFRNFFESYRKSSTPFLRGLSLGCFGALAAYIVNALTHNVMDNSMLFWILGGFSIATTKLALSKRLPTAKETR